MSYTYFKDKQVPIIGRSCDVLICMSILYQKQKCPNCNVPFDHQARAPHFICPQVHMLCRQCIKFLRSSDTCRVCRQPVAFDQIQPNEVLINMLARQNTQNHASIDGASLQQNFGLSPTKPVEDNRQPKVDSYSAFNEMKVMNVNNSIQNPVNTPYQNHEEVVYNNLQDPSDSDCCWKLELKQENRPKHITNFKIKMYFSFLNFILAKSCSLSDCMDRRFDSFGLRDCFLMTFYYDAFLLLILGCGWILANFGHIKQISFKYLTNYIIFSQFLKQFVWAFVQVYLFHAGNSQQCTGGLYLYVLIMTITHYAIIIGLSLLILCGCCYIFTKK